LIVFRRKGRTCFVNHFPADISFPPIEKKGLVEKP
jgi:hypothetical protein